MNTYMSIVHFNIEDKDLNDFFTPFGEVSSVKNTKDKESNKSRGFSFIEMTSDIDGANAIKNLNDAMLAGRAISVTPAKPKENTDFNKNRFQ